MTALERRFPRPVTSFNPAGAPTSSRSARPVPSLALLPTRRAANPRLKRTYKFPLLHAQHSRTVERSGAGTICPPDKKRSVKRINGEHYPAFHQTLPELPD